MMDRNKLGGRRVGMRARLAVAAAVLVGGGAAGVVALAASHGTTAAAQSAGYEMRHGHHHTMNESNALTTAFSGWGRSQARSFSALARMKPMRTFSQVRRHHSMLAAQRGIVVLATRKFLVVRSANGGLHLWWLTRGTRVRNVAATMAGMNAMTGSGMAAQAAMANGDMTPAANLMAGSTQLASQLTAPMASPAAITINSGGETITITIARSTATVTQPMTSTRTTGFVRKFRTTQPVFWHTMGVARGDLAFVAGVRRHGSLFAKIVLFAAPTMTTTPTTMPTTTMTPATMPATMPATTVTPATTVPAGTGTTFSGSHS